MMQRIPDATLERIKDATDIVELVSDHVQLTKRGRSYFGICPFHSEKTGSFSVNPVLQIYRCFGCGEGGNAFKFVQKIDGVSFVEAVSFLAQRSGIPLMLERNTEAAQSNDELFRANEIASKYFQHMLLSDELGRHALQYLEGRGLPKDTIEELKICFAPDSWDGLMGVLNRRGIPPPVVERAGLAPAPDAALPAPADPEPARRALALSAKTQGPGDQELHLVIHARSAPKLPRSARVSPELVLEKPDGIDALDGFQVGDDHSAQHSYGSVCCNGTGVCG